MENMNNEIYSSIVQNSTTGQKEKAKPYKFFKVNTERFKKAIVDLSCGCTVFGALSTAGVTQVIKKINENMEIQDAITSFKNQVISQNTHRTNNDANDFYDYSEIAKSIKTEEDVYLLYRNIGKKDSDRVLSYTEFDTTIDEYLKENGYKDIDEWKDTSNKKILLEKEIVSKQTELDDIFVKHEVNENSQSLGGK